MRRLFLIILLVLFLLAALIAILPSLPDPFGRISRDFEYVVGRARA